MFIPNPVNIDNVELSDDLKQLTEKLAENTHNVWAKQRMSEGWIYGKSRNDNVKTTPCLVPYSDLPENEKEYDRNTAISAIKLIIAMGYKIEKIN